MVVPGRIPLSQFRGRVQSVDIPIHLLYLIKRVFPPGYWAFTTVFHNVANRILPGAQRARKEIAQ